MAPRVPGSDVMLPYSVYDGFNPGIFRHILQNSGEYSMIAPKSLILRIASQQSFSCACGRPALMQK